MTRLRDFQPSDLPFLRGMLYEAVFWKDRGDRPSMDEALAYPEVRNALAGWGSREGDTAVIATVESDPVGAAWYRYWTDTDNTRGYIEERIPVVAIGVRADYRCRGIGMMMLDRLVDRANRQTVSKLSLCVSKNNPAVHLYRRCGYREYEDIGQSLVMVRTVP